MLDEIRLPSYELKAWRIADSVDLTCMREEAQSLIGTHDFRAFRSSNDLRTNTVRTILNINIVESSLKGACLVQLEVEGTAFLHNMVRIIVGTLVDVARGRLPRGAVVRALVSGDRKHLGMTAPAQGLCLNEIRWLDKPMLSDDYWPRS